MEMLDETTPFGIWAEMWGSKKTVGKKYTYFRSIRSFLNHLKPIYDIPVGKVKTMHIESVILALAENNPNTGKPASKKLLNNIKSAAKSIIDYAINNCDELYRNRATAVEIPTEAPITERMSLPMIQQHLIFSTPHRARLPVLIMLLCGLRVGEMIALTWEQIDFKEGIISVCQSAYNVNSNKLAIQNHTKNGKKRNVPIPPQLIDVLKKYKCLSKSRFVTTKSRGNDMHSRGSWKRMWESYLETLEIIFTAHQLRHTYASMLYAAGVDVKTASELLGHSDIEITMKIYTHLTEQGKKLSIDKYNIFLSEHFSEFFTA